MSIVSDIYILIFLLSFETENQPSVFVLKSGSSSCGVFWTAARLSRSHGRKLHTLILNIVFFNSVSNVCSSDFHW